MAEVKYKAEGTVKVSSRLNVRQGNGTGTKIIGKLYTGDKLKISAKTTDKKFNDLGTMRNGYKIEYKGATAYVCDRYVNITKEYKDEDSSNSNSNNNNNSDDTYILTGNAKIEPNFELRVGETVNLQGLGKYLSGAYFIEEISISITKTDLTQTLAVSKNAFGESINAKPPQSSSGSNSKPPTTQEAVKPKEEPKRTHTLKNGETLWGLSVKYYGTGTKWPVIAKANGIDPSDDKTIRSLRNGRVFTIPYL